MHSPRIAWQAVVVAVGVVGLAVGIAAGLWQARESTGQTVITPTATITVTTVATPRLLQPLIENDGGERVLLTRPKSPPRTCRFDHWAWNGTIDYAAIKCRGENHGDLLVVKTEYLTPLELAVP